ncbi:MAG: hypothetical protein ACJ8AI_06330 [Rhodopila sp.]
MEASQGGCGLTVLRCQPNRRLAKRWTWNPHTQCSLKSDFDGGAFFRPTECTFDDLDGLAALIEEIQRDPQLGIVRGALTEEVREQARTHPNAFFRRLKNRKGNIAPTFAEAPRSWIMVDIDRWRLRGSDDLVDDPDSAVDFAIHELLPAEFHDVRCFWQMSSSAWFVPGILKVHLFFWLSEPATSDHVRRVFEQHAPAVDRAPFNTVQLHYVAAPIIEGRHDPLPRRTGWRDGAETSVVLPALQSAHSKAGHQARPADGTGGSYYTSSSVDEALSFLGDGDGLRGFHAPLLDAGMRYASECRRCGQRDDKAYKKRACAAIRAAPAAPGRDTADYYTSDPYLDHNIDGAFRVLENRDKIEEAQPDVEAASDSLGAAQAELDQHVAALVDRALTWHRLTGFGLESEPAPQALIAADLGVGKTYAVQAQLAARYIEAARKVEVPHRVLWLVPNHDLSAETVKTMKELGLNAMVFYGRSVPNPAAVDPVTGEMQPMCENLDAIGDSVEAGYSISQTACGTNKPGEPTCPFYNKCGYQAQRAAAAHADVIVFSHNGLFHRLPKELREGIGLCIVDESFWQHGVRKNQINPVATFAETPRLYPVRMPKPGNPLATIPDLESTNDLIELCSRLQKATTAIREAAEATGQTKAFFNRTSVLNAGLTAELCAGAVKLEEKRELKGRVWPGQPRDARKNGVKEARAVNTDIPRRIAVWKSLQELLEGDAEFTGRLQISTEKRDDGTDFVAIICHRRAKIHEDIEKLPLLLLDATAEVDILKCFLPRLEVAAELRCATPHVRFHQVIGGWGRTSLVPFQPKAGAPPMTEAQVKENARRLRMVRHVADFVRSTGEGSAGVVTYEAIEHEFADIHGAVTAHFNKLVGLNRMKHVRHLVVLGRPLPRPEELYTIALAITGLPLEYQETQKVVRGALLTNGKGAGITTRAYADKTLELFRRAICDAEVFQAVGRGRAVRRTANDPLDVWCLCDVLLPGALDSLTQWESHTMDPVKRMAARGAVIFSPSDAAAMYRDLFETPDAARMALDRCGPVYSEQSPMIDSTLRGLFGISAFVITYQPAGRGQRSREAYVAGWRLPGLRELMDDEIGLMKVWQVEPLSEQPKQPDIAEPSPQPAPPVPDVPAPVPVTLPPVTGMLVIRQPDSVALIPVDDELAFWNDHPFFRPPEWILPWDKTMRKSGSVEEDLGHG